MPADNTNPDNKDIDPTYKTLLDDNTKLKEKISLLETKVEKICKFNEALLDRDNSQESAINDSAKAKKQEELDKKFASFCKGK